MRRSIARMLGLVVLPATAVLLFGRVAPRSLDRAMAATSVLIAAAFLLAVAIVAFGVVRGTVRAVGRSWLLRTGAGVPGRVMEARVFGIGLPTVDDVVIAELAVALDGGARIVGLRERLDADAVPSVGAVVAVVVDPRRPRHAWLRPEPTGVERVQPGRGERVVPHVAGRSAR